MKLHGQHISLTYPEATQPVFADLSFALDGPGFHALFGPSGVGKTTLAQILVGRIRPATGLVDGVAPERRLYSYNMERLPGWSSVGRHLDKVTPPASRAQKDTLAADFGLSAVLDRRFRQLSLGQKNRINLVRYLVQDFDLLIMDESLANVDERTRQRIILRIKRLFPDKFFLYISHNLAEVARFCRRVLVLGQAHHRPQARVVAGCDQLADQPADAGALQQTMLSIMDTG